MPRLRVLAGPSPDQLKPICANTNRAHPIKSPYFEGKVVVHIKNFPDENGDVLESEYFDREDRRNVTWSIQVQGRFLQPHTSNDILFGNTFDRPLKLPWGAGAALKFMHFIDPTLEHDLTSKTSPWALSPLISTMPHFHHTPAPLTSDKDSDATDDTPEPPHFPLRRSLTDDLSRLKLRNGLSKSVSLSTANKRRGYFSSPSKRQAITFGPEDVITTDFCYGFIVFPELHLCLPGGISFDLNRYWDGQPVRFVCCERTRDGQPLNEGTMFWCVSIERVSEEDLDY